VRGNTVYEQWGLTIVEMVIAMAIIAIVFAAILPQFRAIMGSWDSKAGSAETLQNGRVLIEHLNRNLSQAVRISAVSESSETSGYIEFENNDANTLRYDVDANSYVEFGIVGELYELAGPVSQFQFTCYDACDLDTPLPDVNDVNSIRFVKVQTTLTNPATLAQDKTFTASAYLRTNSASGTEESLTMGTPFEYDASTGGTPALAQIDSTHYLCAYMGPGFDGWAVVLTVDTDTWDITKGTAFEYDTDNGETPVLAQIDQTHYLCAYTGNGSDGWAVVLTVSTGTWTITKETPFEFDSQQGTTPALSKIDNGHYLCTYVDKFSDGWAFVLTVDTGNWTITKETPFEFDSQQGTTPALSKIDNSHYLCTYVDRFSDGWAFVLTVDTGNWSITNETPLEYDIVLGKIPALAQIDSTHYLCAYEGAGTDGWAVVLTVDTSTWDITKGTAFEFDASNGETPALAKIDDTHYLCAYDGNGSDGWATVLTVDTGNWTISRGADLEFDASTGITPALAQIDPNDYLCAYGGPDSDGWAVVLNYNPATGPPVGP
jgi:prepilin-type N-terminal cleavage/methylation domain-containing protein